MKFFSLSAFFLIVGFSMVCASPLEKKDGTKITKNEAEHIALAHHPGARVAAAKLESGDERKVWAIEIAQGEHHLMVAVDAISGRVLQAATDDR